MPIVPFHLEGPSGTRFPVRGLIDTGASRCLFPADWAEPLGVQIADCQIVEGGTASGDGEFHLGPKPLRLYLGDIAIEVLALFGGHSEVLLGRDDFLSHFYLSIDHRGRRVYLRPYDEAPDP